MTAPDRAHWNLGYEPDLTGDAWTLRWGIGPNAEIYAANAQIAPTRPDTAKAWAARLLAAAYGQDVQEWYSHRRRPGAAAEYRAAVSPEVADPGAPNLTVF